jgi:hypothetical protein
LPGHEHVRDERSQEEIPSPSALAALRLGTRDARTKPQAVMLAVPSSRSAATAGRPDAAMSRSKNTRPYDDNEHPGD